MDYAVYRPRTRILERALVYAIVGVSDSDSAHFLWPSAYRRATTVSATTPAKVAVLGEVLMGDILLPPISPALLCTGESAWAEMPRPSLRRPASA